MKDKVRIIKKSQSPYGAQSLATQGPAHNRTPSETRSHVSCPLREAPPPRLPGHHARGIDR